jgi:F-type H+-transporting ATPase subunit a
MSHPTEQHPETSVMSTESSHQQTLFAEEITSIGGFPITNSLLNTWAVLFVILIFGLYLKKRIKEVPGRLQNILEMTVDGFLGIFDSVTGSRQKSMLFFPFVFSFFILILLNNWLGLLPGVGSIGLIFDENGHEVFAPYFRGGMADLNSTLALAIIGVVASHIFGVVALGWWRHFNKFVNIKALLDIPGKVAKDPMVLIVNPIHVFVGFIEIIGEMAKIASLSFRLFGNIFAGEVLLASMGAILAFGLPIPFMFMEVLVGAIQALVFSMLILAYLSMSTSAEEH